MTRFDVVVAGGGPAGAAAALTLAGRGRRVLLAGGGGGGVPVGEACPGAARPLLCDLGVLVRVAADGHRPCVGTVSVWGADEPSATDALFDPHGPGWHLDRERFDASLRTAAADAGAEVRPVARVGRAERDGAGWRVAVGGETVGCGWLVDATGRPAAVARRAGAVRRRTDQLVAVVARCRWAGADARTLVEAGPDGWWYTAPVPAGGRVVAFFTDPDLFASGDLRLGDSRHVARLLAGAEVGRPRGADAGTTRLARPVGLRWAAVGDAAAAFDPLSGQGILTALYTGLRAGQAIDRALAGDGVGLVEYARRVAAVAAAYRWNRAAHYAAERRWADRPFWRRRHPPAAVGSRGRASACGERGLTPPLATSGGSTSHTGEGGRHGGGKGERGVDDEPADGRGSRPGAGGDAGWRGGGAGGPGAG